MGLTAVSCAQSHIVLRLERGEEGAHGFDSRRSVPRSHIVLRLERGEEGAHGTTVFLFPESHRPQIRERRGRSSWDNRLSVPRPSFCAQSHIVLRLERGEEGAYGFDSRLLCLESYRAQIRERRGRSSWVCQPSFCAQSHIVLRLEREDRKELIGLTSVCLYPEARSLDSNCN
ncbi:hypothetical protein J6590_073834 [Homalodisca vitripennis]|nr:hypothetical protein J6590_073834 [Homalodisca vitripennis]